MSLSESWATLWESIADAQADHVAVVLGDRRIRWRELDERAARLAGALAARGVGSGHAVAQMLYNSPEYLESVYAAIKLRAAPANVNHRYLADEIVHVCASAGARALFFHGSLGPRVQEAAARLPELELLVQVDDGSPLIEGAIEYETLLASAEPAPRIERSGEDTLLLFTGGTTGLPKAVVWRHVDLFGALAFTGYLSAGLAVPETAEEVGRTAAMMAAAGRSPVNLCAPPLMHGTALFLAISTFVLGGTVVLLGGRRYDPEELVKLAERERATQLSIVGDPFATPMVEVLVAAAAAGRPYDLSSLQRIVTTGATMSAENKRALLAHTPAMILDMIGASEGGPYALAVTPPGGDPQATAQFIATAQTVLFDDETWEPIPFGSGKAGVLASSGAMPRGYLGDPERTARTFREINGVRYTIPGDYALIDADGTVHLLGRGSVCINTGGEKVYPEEVENAAKTMPGVRDAVAVGVPDPRFGEAVTLVAAADPAITADALTEHVKAHLASYKAPRHVVFVEAVLRSPSGKADYRWAKATALDGLAGGGS
jgi:acyl-CoA synthetase (AMP-forming)/AMP-acid ligase II